MLRIQKGSIKVRWSDSRQTLISLIKYTQIFILPQICACFAIHMIFCLKLSEVFMKLQKLISTYYNSSSFAQRNLHVQIFLCSLTSAFICIL